MNNEYIIVNKTLLEKRIEELHYYYGGIRPADEPFYAGELSALEELISQSTPLIPEIEKAFDAGRTVKNYKGEWKETFSDIMTSPKYEESKDYISNLKLDI